MNTSSSLTVIAFCTAFAGKEHLLRATQEKLVAETIRESGCLRYELHQSIEDGRILLFIENWASREQWEAHMQGDAIKNFQSSGAVEYLADIVLHQMKLITDGKGC